MYLMSVHYFTILLILYHAISSQCNSLGDDLKHSFHRVGGVHAKYGEFPFQVSLQLRENHICSGALISTIHVLTVAQCTYELNEDGVMEHVDSSEFQVVAGTLDRLNSNPRGQTRSVQRISIHEEYSPNVHSMDYNIALIEVADEFFITSDVMPVTIRDRVVSTGEMCFSIGWGITHSKGLPTRHLSKVIMPTLDYKRCSSKYGYHLDNNLLCVGYARREIDVCQSELGSPLICDGELTGLLSWRFACFQSTFPNIFLNISSHQTWIEEASSFGHISSASNIYLILLFVVFMDVIVK